MAKHTALTSTLFVVAAFVSAIPAKAGPCGMRTPADGYAQLDEGFHALYDLDFAGGEKRFLVWQSQHPRNPLAPASRASGALFQEFERLGVLKEQVFVDDQQFEQRRRLAPSPVLKARFEEDLTRADLLADEMLAHNLHSTDALLAKTFVNGLRADYAALIEKQNIASLAYTKEGRRWAEQLLQTDATCYDAYLALGAENYLVSIKPVVVRWMARLGGAQANREVGIHELTLTAQNGRFLQPFAKLLLVLVAQRDHDPSVARRLLAELQQEFPNNPLYGEELRQLDSRSSAPAR